MTDALLLFTFGPVQPFIAAGRRTADLWAGSHLLSHLAERALSPVRGALGDDAVLFPVVGAAGDDSAPAAYPNRYLARVPVDEADALARASESAVRGALREAAEYAFRRIGRPDDAAAAADEAARFAETAWVAVPMDAARLGPLRDALLGGAPLDGDPWTGHYGGLYRATEAVLGGRKALRDFDGREESGHRATLTSSLPAYVPDPEAPTGEVRAFWDGVADRSGGRVREGERLSVVGLAKRYAPDRSRGGTDAPVFPSTSTFATADFVRDLQRAVPDDNRLAEAVGAFEDKARAFLREVDHRYREAPVPGLDRPDQPLGLLPGVSGRLLLGDDLTADDVERDAGARPSEAALDALGSTRRDLLAAAERAGIRPPSRYYGVLLLDGDRMGDWLAGALTFAEGDARRGLRGPERHRAVSRALGHFAGRLVRPAVEGDGSGKGPLGRVVYAGGDDVLALLSFETALEAARAVRAAFSDPDAMGAGATASAGLVLAHHLAPLQRVLDAARSSEKAAKDAGRDRVAVTALPRGGSSATAVVGWDALGPLEAYAGLVRGGRVSTGFAYDVRELADRLADPNGAWSPALDAAFGAELRRVFGRRTERADGATADGAFDSSVGPLLGAARAAYDREVERAAEAGRPPDPRARPPFGVFRRLRVAQFLGLGGDR